MSKGTDLRASGEQGITAEQKCKAAEALAMTAGHLASIDPDRDIDELAFAAVLGAKVYDVGGRSGSGGGVRISRLALEAVGEVPDGVTRVEFAVTVAQAARTLGYDWSTDDNRRLVEGVAG
ncbi:hypothetical protein [Streptomyces afghaniensis]|uniref:hypothetical protein n=1 Tax=Streptomyces afghaniensis TaxID=66865 RepID=UPI00277EA388|nr:hypothetical protein [Streptomyces afghaniensis]MDQ1018842.1 hypothetical protein [Streptomyces afghaniensis]